MPDRRIRAVRRECQGWCWEPGRGRRLRLGSQRRLRERVELRDRSARDAEDLAAPPPEGDPGLEGGDAFGAQALEQRERQIGWQCVFHVGQFSHFGAFAKRDLTSSRDNS